MRRATREITDRDGIEDILARAEVLFLAIHDEPAPYVIPLSFAFADGALWFHCAIEGTKLDLIHRNPAVGFSAVVDAGVVSAPAACDFSARGSSVVGRGTARVCTDPDEHRRGLDALMRRYGMGAPDYRADTLARTRVVRIDVEEVRGKRLA
jgi:nitroimidazol reductase NimA-like FMN-containing flavoprotein (pyridoxamine 5'-phosphate oxidase superfamily)